MTFAPNSGKIHQPGAVGPVTRTSADMAGHIWPRTAGQLAWWTRTSASPGAATGTGFPGTDMCSEDCRILHDFTTLGIVAMEFSTHFLDPLDIGLLGFYQNGH